MDKVNAFSIRLLAVILTAAALASPAWAKHPAEAGSAGKKALTGINFCLVNDGVAVPLPAGKAQSPFPEKVLLRRCGAETELALSEAGPGSVEASYRDKLGGLWKARRQAFEQGQLVRTLFFKPDFYAYRLGDGPAFVSLVNLDAGAVAASAAAPARAPVNLAAARGRLTSAKEGIAASGGFGLAADGSRNLGGDVAGPVSAAGLPDAKRPRPPLAVAAPQPAQAPAAVETMARARPPRRRPMIQRPRKESARSPVGSAPRWRLRRPSSGSVDHPRHAHRLARDLDSGGLGRRGRRGRLSADQRNPRNNERACVQRKDPQNRPLGRRRAGHDRRLGFRIIHPPRPGSRIDRGTDYMGGPGRRGRRGRLLADQRNPKADGLDPGKDAGTSEGTRRERRDIKSSATPRRRPGLRIRDGTIRKVVSLLFA